VSSKLSISLAPLCRAAWWACVTDADAIPTRTPTRAAGCHVNVDVRTLCAQGVSSLRELPTANPTGFLLACLMLAATLLLSWYGMTDHRRLRHSLRDNEGKERERYEADAATFAAHRRQQEDKSVPWTSRAPGMLRTGWLAGSVCAPVKGDPWLRSQRAFMVCTQVWVALALSCIFYVEEVELDETTNTTELVEANGLQASLLTAAFAVPVRVHCSRMCPAPSCCFAVCF
jgi:hypothetical protein